MISHAELLEVTLKIPWDQATLSHSALHMWFLCIEHHPQSLTSPFIVHLQSTKQSSPHPLSLSPQGPPPWWCLPGFPRWHGPGSWHLPPGYTYLGTHLQLSHPSYTAFSFYTALSFCILKWFAQGSILAPCIKNQSKINGRSKRKFWHRDLGNQIILS